MLFVLDIAVSLHLLCFNSYCILNPASQSAAISINVYVCMHVLNREDPASYRIFLELMLTFSERFLQKQTKQYKNCNESLTDSYELFADGYVLLRVIYDCCELFTRVVYRKINPWTLVRRFLTCQCNGGSGIG